MDPPTDNEVIKIIAGLDINKSFGIDGIIFRYCSGIISPILSTF